jgi:hypothetical protein
VVLLLQWKCLCAFCCCGGGGGAFGGIFFCGYNGDGVLVDMVIVLFKKMM